MESENLTNKQEKNDETKTEKVENNVVKFPKKKKKGNRRNKEDISNEIQQENDNNDIKQTTQITNIHENKLKLSNENDNNDTSEKLKNMKFVQKLRDKDKGLTFETDTQFTESGLENPDEVFRVDPEKQFGESFAKENIQDDILKEQREEWINQEMRKKLLESGRVLPQDKQYQTNKCLYKVNNTNDDDDNNNDDNGQKNAKTLKEELYALPKNNKLLSSIASNNNENEAGERWLAGMMEVELPIEYKLKNIEQTEQAKKDLLMPKPQNEQVFEIPRNYNQDFTTHHYERVQLFEHKRKTQEKQQRVKIDRDKKRRRLFGPQ